MTYAIVYSSRTGNTERLAQAIRQALPPEECLYFGPAGPPGPRRGADLCGFLDR